MKAEIGHDRDRDPAAVQPSDSLVVHGRESDQLVAVDDMAATVDGQHAVPVSVEGEADGVISARHRLGQPLDVRGPDSGVDVAPVGAVGQHVDLGPQAPEDLGSHTEGGAVGAIEENPRATQIEVGETRVQLAQVVLERAVQLPDAADALGSRGRARDLPLDCDLGLVRELEAVGGKEFDAVVLVRVVRGRYHRRQLQTVAADQQRRGRCRQHPAEQDITPGGGDTGGDGRLEHLARFTRVADDQDLRMLLLAELDGRA